MPLPSLKSPRSLQEATKEASKKQALLKVNPRPPERPDDAEGAPTPPQTVPPTIDGTRQDASRPVWAISTTTSPRSPSNGGLRGSEERLRSKDMECGSPMADRAVSCQSEMTEKTLMDDDPSERPSGVPFFETESFASGKGSEKTRHVNVISRASARLALGRCPGDDSESYGQQSRAVSRIEPGGTFVDVAAMKERMRQNLVKKKYNVQDLYKKDGIWQKLARDAQIEQFTLGTIIINALWISIDTDHNDSELLLDAHWVFQLAENGFCAFFFFEWLTRLLAFRRKRDCLMDGWMLFDGLMVSLMILETWVFCSLVLLMSSDDNFAGDASVMRIARLLRLSRMCRMARLLRAMPELFILMKGLFAAARSVFFTLVMLCIILFVFGIAFTQLTAKTQLGLTYFAKVPNSMYFLLIHGTLLLSTDYKVMEIAAESEAIVSPFVLNTIYMFFILLTAILLMNMLIGVLCEMVSVVAAAEKEQLLGNYVGSKVHQVMALIDEDGGGTISREEFMMILDNADAMQAMAEAGVDVVGLVDFADFIFGEDDDYDPSGGSGEQVELTPGEFLDVIMQLRGSNNSTVKDVVDLRKFIRSALSATNQSLSNHTRKIDILHTLCRSVSERLDTQVQLSTELKTLVKNLSDVHEKAGRQALLPAGGGAMRSTSSSASPRSVRARGQRERKAASAERGGRGSPSPSKEKSEGGNVADGAAPQWTRLDDGTGSGQLEPGDSGVVPPKVSGGAYVMVPTDIIKGGGDRTGAELKTGDDSQLIDLKGRWCVIEAGDVRQMADKLYCLLQRRTMTLDQTMVQFQMPATPPSGGPGSGEQPRPAASQAVEDNGAIPKDRSTPGNQTMPGHERNTSVKAVEAEPGETSAMPDPSRCLGSSSPPT
eukprot:TRINITY_DN37152_c0_g1_i1.p1 TRINITY_DN37152_c0_g1~~TRINITY_DN37152_c0_g1_i1.p1  ORF type:complete len:885 (+),score=229.80 TRINITY_DN37152_c0_g1_i1:215-2869(+)